MSQHPQHTASLQHAQSSGGPHNAQSHSQSTGSDLPVDFVVEPDPAPRQQRVRTGHTIPDWIASIEEDGRKYQGYKPGVYLLPIDGDEQERQDLQHAIFLMQLNNKLIAAPVRSPKHVLDIGTGTGIWALQFAKENPESRVIGTDLSLIQPPTPPNCHFYLEDSEKAEWCFQASFDFVHIRSMGPCFDDITTVLQKSYTNMVPGGWIELADSLWELQCQDNTVRGTSMEQFFQKIIIGGARLGRDMIKAKYYKDYLTHVGFVDVEQQIHVVPLSDWPKDLKLREIGRFVGHALWFAVDSYRKFLAAAGLSPAEVDELAKGVREEIENPNIHGFLIQYFVWGRKPHNWENLSPETRAE